VMVAIAIMYIASGPISGFVKRNPTTKMLALAFLLLIGVALIADGLGFHIPRAYIYFSMAFAAIIEIFNVLARRRRKRS
jgi:predicted tellurium resistance membrane protein TerC